MPCVCSYTKITVSAAGQRFNELKCPRVNHGVQTPRVLEVHFSKLCTAVLHEYVFKTRRAC